MRFQFKPLVIALAVGGLSLPILPAFAETNSANALHAEFIKVNQNYLTVLSQGGSLNSAIDAAVSKAQQATAANDKSQAYVAAALLAWRAGQLDNARNWLTQAVSADASVNNLQLLAAFEDANANVAAAKRRYQQLLPLVAQQAQADVAEKMALLSGSIDGYAALAKKYPQQQLPMAQWLALLDDNKAASSLALSVKSRSVTDNLELADWLLASKNFRAAADAAWQSFTLADDDADRRYALALFTEAWRNAGDLAAAEKVFAKASSNTLVLDMRIDLLLELGQYDSALKLIAQSDDANIKARRGAILALANRNDELRADYRAQIAAKPAELTSYNGLAAEFVNQGDNAAAIAVYQQFAQHNGVNLPLLLDAAKRMIAMGLSDAAISMVEHATSQAQGASAQQANISLQLFLFDTYLNQGEQAQAEQVLVTLDKLLPKDSLSRLALAENYERLQQPTAALACLKALANVRGNLGYDQQLHIASLAYSTGDKADALARWQQLWQQAKLPARRNFLENRIVEVATELNQLTPMATTLANSLAAGGASQQDVNLLVSLYLAQHQTDSALAAVETFAKQHALPEVSRLQQLASIYGRERDYQKLNQVWRQLAELDSSNAGQYWQQITLNSLRNNVFDSTPKPGMTPKEQRTEQLDGLLAKLAENGQQVDQQFAASLYAQAGLPERAVSAYQQALAQQPDNSDNLLQLVELLKKQQQFAEATSLLQLQFITADNSDSRFAAVDGILNLFAGGEEGLPQAAQMLAEQTLQWLQRRLFELASHSDDRERALQALGDLGQQQGNFALTEQATRQLLALSRHQRAAMLRALVSQYSGASEPGVSSGPAIGDNSKKLQFGRRLLAMQQEFPPALYSDLAQSLLAVGDVLGAERAFSMMIDIPGIVNVKQQKGLAYANAGYEQRALTFFQQALVTEQSDLELLVNTALLQQQLGERKSANHWYWQGLENLLSRQSLQSDGQQAQIFSDINRYFAVLSEGLVLTWPLQGETAKQLQQQLQQLNDSTLQQTLPLLQNNPQPLNNYPRLQAVLELNRNVAAFTGHWQMLQQLERQLAPSLSSDAQYQQARANYWHYRGQPLQGSAVGSPLAQLSQQALANDNFPLQLMSSLAKQDWSQVANLAKQVMSAYNGNDNSPQQQMLKSQYFSLLQQGFERLPRQQFIEQLWPLLMQAHDAELVKFQVLRYQPQIFNAVAKAQNAALLSNQRITELLISNSNAAIPYGLNTAAGDGAFNAWLVKQLSTAELIDFYQQLQQFYQQQTRQLPIQPLVLDELLARQLTKAQQQTVAKVLLQSATFAPNGQNSAAAIVSQLLLLDVASDNQTVLLQAAQTLVQQRPDCQGLLPFLQQFFAGNRAAAYQQLLQLRQDVSASMGYDFSAPLIERYFRAERQQRIDAFMAQSQASKAVSAAFYRDIVAGNHNPQQRIEYLTHLQQLDSDNPLYVSELLTTLWQQQRYKAFSSTLAHWLTKADSSDNQLLLQLAEAVTNGAAVEPPLDVDSLVAWLNKSAAGAPGISSLYGAVFQQYARLFPNDAAVAALRDRQGSSEMMSPQQNGLNVKRLAARFQQSPAQAIELLSTMWGNALPGRKQFGGDNLSRDELIHSRFDLQGNQQQNRAPLSAADIAAATRASTDLLAEIAKQPAATAMFDAWLRAMPEDQAATEQRLYDLIIAGWQAQGSLPNNTQVLWQQLPHGLTRHQLQLLLTGLTHARSQLTAEQQAGLQQHVQQVLLITPNNRMQLAQLAAASGDYQNASEWLQAAAWQISYPAMTQANRMAAMQPEALNMQRIVDALAGWQDKAAAEQCLTQLLNMMLTGKQLSSAASSLWQSFAMSASAAVLGDKALNFVSTWQPEWLQMSKSADEAVPMWPLAQAELYLATSNTTKAAALLAQALGYTAPAREWSNYDRAQQMLAISLFGNVNNRSDDEHLAEWLADLVTHLDDVSSLVAPLTAVAADKSITLNPASWTDLILLAAQRCHQQGEPEVAAQFLQLGLQTLTPQQAEYRQKLQQAMQSATTN